MTQHHDPKSLLLAPSEQQALGLPPHLSKLYEALQPELRRQASRDEAVAGGSVDAEEILREVWTQAARAWPKIKNSGIPVDEYVTALTARALRPTLHQQPAPCAPQPRPPLTGPPTPRPPIAPLDAMLRQVQELTAEILGHGDTETVDTERTFHELGFDSLNAIELRDRLTEATGLPLKAAVAFAHPTPLALARHLHERRNPAEQLDDPDPAAAGFEEFYQRLHTRLYKRTNTLLGPAGHQDVDDVLQTVWMTVLEHWARIKRMDHPQAYVYVITRNEAFRARRAAAQRHTRTPLTEDAELTLLAESTTQFQARPVDQIIDEEGLKQYIAEQIAPRLSRQQLTILLMETAGYGTDAIAEALGIELATVRVQRHRTRKKLAGMLTLNRSGIGGGSMR
ncbi:sigma-70 family RNA polymerase sigma factor [Streptomyces sp. NPDC054844]